MKGLTRQVIDKNSSEAWINKLAYSHPKHLVIHIFRYAHGSSPGRPYTGQEPWINTFTKIKFKENLLPDHKVEWNEKSLRKISLGEFKDVWKLYNSLGHTKRLNRKSTGNIKTLAWINWKGYVLKRKEPSMAVLEISFQSGAFLHQQRRMSSNEEFKPPKKNKLKQNQGEESSNIRRQKTTEKIRSHKLMLILIPLYTSGVCWGAGRPYTSYPQSRELGQVTGKWTHSVLIPASLVAQQCLPILAALWDLAILECILPSLYC